MGYPIIANAACACGHAQNASGSASCEHASIGPGVFAFTDCIDGRCGVS
jgi:hypothetical protein